MFIKNTQDWAKNLFGNAALGDERSLNLSLT
jgi:hypothetical protein